MTMRCQKDWCYSNSMFTIKTSKVLQIHSVWYGILKWVICVLIIIYVCIGLWSKKMYQRQEPLISSVHTKIKGIAEVNIGNKTRVWDTADYTFPLQGNSFFVITNFVTTEDQMQGICPEYPTNRTCCSSDQDCRKGRINPLSKGVQTGNCIKYNMTNDHPKIHDLSDTCKHQKTCEVAAWCPIEPRKNAPRPALLASAENFTVLIKNSIHFPGHNYSTRNILPGIDISCTFHKTLKPDCPIFRLGDILQEAGANFSSVAIHGGIVGIEIYWDCNLDAWFYSCKPKYSFHNLDDEMTKSLHPESSWFASVLSGSFRYAKYYKEGGVEKRTLIKAFGVRFDILVFGTGGKFDIIQLIMYIGSTLSYFGLATVLIDFLIHMYTMNCCRSWVYRFCKVCEPCAVNEDYYKRKYEINRQPWPALKYFSFVDEPCIRVVKQDSLKESLQDMKSEEIPRPQKDFIDLAKLSLPIHPVTSPSRVPQEEIQFLMEEPSSPSQARPERPQKNFIKLANLSPPPHPDASSSHVPQEEIQLLIEKPTSPPQARPEWCRCGHCHPSQLPESSKFIEELCCRRERGPCITTSALFEELVLSRSTLRFILLYQEPLLEMDADALNNQLRRCAYRCYIEWRFGYEDMADLAILPSCCRWKIRECFPKKDGNYTGFRSPNRQGHI